MSVSFDESGAAAKPKLVFCHENDSKMFKSPDAILRKMFEKQDGSWEMVASDGLVYKFDEFVLSEQVEHFQEILSKPGTKEYINKQVIVPAGLEMTGAAVEAFLRYVYYQDTAPINSSFGITFALIRAGHHYKIPEMVTAAYDVIVEKSPSYGIKLEWFNFEDLWKLYQLIWKWDEDHPSRTLLMKAIALVMKKGFKDDVISKLLPDSDEKNVLKDLLLDLVGDWPLRVLTGDSASSDSF